MNIRRRTALIVSFMVLSLTLATAASHAQATFDVHLRYAPTWTDVSGTRVQVIRGERPSDYDIFRLDNRYYVYSNDRWYVSDNWRGSFRYVETRTVPYEISRVPRNYWLQYPVDWNDRDRDWRDRDVSPSGTIQLRMSTSPRWTLARGSRVYVVDRNDPSDYDVFRYDNTYYLYEDGRWYRANHWSGTFTAIEMSLVPAALIDLPREYWRRYPTTGWRDDRRDWRDDDRRASMRVNFRGRPRWYTVPSTRVMMVSDRYRTDFDIFRYGDTYYVYQDGRWFMSRNWNGNFTYVDDHRVPRAIAMVPRRYWLDYPDDWANRYRSRR